MDQCGWQEQLQVTCEEYKSKWKKRKQERSILTCAVMLHAITSQRQRANMLIYVCNFVSFICRLSWSQNSETTQRWNEMVLFIDQKMMKQSTCSKTESSVVKTKRANWPRTVSEDLNEGAQQENQLCHFNWPFLLEITEKWPRLMSTVKFLQTTMCVCLSVCVCIYQVDNVMHMSRFTLTLRRYTAPRRSRNCEVLNGKSTSLFTQLSFLMVWLVGLV